MRAELVDDEVRVGPKNWPGSGVVTIDAGQRRALVLRTGGGVLWDLETREAVEGPFIALPPTGDRIVRTHDATRWALVDLETGQTQRLVPAGTASFSPFDGWATRRLATDLDAGTTPRRGAKSALTLVDLANDALHEIETQATLGAFLPGGRLAVVDASGRVDVWDLATRKLAKKLGTLKRKPELLRVDRAGKRLLAYGKDKKFASALRVWDATTYAPVAERDVPWVRLGDHVHFDDGRHLVGDVTIWDVDADRTHDFWLGVYHGTPHVASLRRSAQGELCAVLCLRDPTAIRPQLELWDLGRRVRIGALQLPARRPQVIAGADARRVAVLHSVGGRPIYDDRDDPALSTYRVTLDAEASDPEQPQPGSSFFEQS